MHGEAIALGMLMAADLSHRLGWLSEDVSERLEKMLLKLNLPVALPDGLDTEKMRELMSVDKKSKRWHVIFNFAKRHWRSCGDR